MSSRAQMVLWYDEGYRKVEIAVMSGASRPTVDKWLARYERFGLEGLVSMTSPGGPRQISGQIRVKMLALTRTTPPSAPGISRWSSTEMARYVKKTEGVYVSQTWVSRLWRENHLKPWQQGTFKMSKDPHFEDKVRDVVGLYLDPPEGEVVVSVDAKSGIHALDRTQPLLPIDFGKTQKRTFDYARMGTTDLYAATDIRTGEVITSLSRTHATPDFLRLMKKVVAAYSGQKIHVVLDNASVHLSADTEKWLAKQNGNVVFHFTPTGSSWMNQIEIWNGILTRKLIRCGTFRSVKALDREIDAFVKHWNSDCKPFTWTATAEEIIDKVRAITAHTEALLRATEIDDVARQAA
ncbi:MAG: IS630 family transposase [Pseudonocardiaceae bacterium]